MDAPHSAETFHILAPPALGIIFTALSFVDHRIIKAKASSLLSDQMIPDELKETIERMVSGAVTLATFMANGLLFIMNCLIAFFVFPESERLLVTYVCALVVIVVVYEIIWIFVTYDLDDIADVKRAFLTVDTWLRLQQVGFNIAHGHIFLYRLLGLPLTKVEGAAGLPRVSSKMTFDADKNAASSPDFSPGRCE